MHLRPCLDSASVRSRESLVAIRLAPVILSVTEDACNIVSHLSIDRTLNKPGILRQARYIQAVLKQTCQRITQVAQVWSEKSFLSFVEKFLECNLQRTAGCSLQVYMGKACLKPSTSKYCGTFMNHPGLWFLFQQHWSVPRHVTLWQKMLVTLPVTFPLTLLTASALYAGKMQDSNFFPSCNKKLFWKLT